MIPEGYEEIIDDNGIVWGLQKIEPIKLKYKVTYERAK